MGNQIQQTTDQVINLITSYGLSFLGAVIILIIGFKASKWLSNITYKGLKKAPNMDETLNRFFSSLVRYAVLAFTVVAALSNFGIQTTGLIAVLGAAGLAIGLALQGTLSHVASGVMLLLFRPFKIGDYVEVAGFSGTVYHIGLFMTELTTTENIRIIVPNGKVWDSSVVNYNLNETRRIEIVLGISYEDSIEKALKMVENILAKEKRILADPASGVVVAELADSSVNIRIRAWTARSDFWATKFDLIKALKLSCDEEGISIPYPQRDIHVVNGGIEEQKAS